MPAKSDSKVAVPKQLAGASARPITKAAQSLRTRTLIVNTAIKCLYKHGYSGTSMNLIAKQAGISRGPLNYYFENPNDLMAAVAETLPTNVTEATRKRLYTAITLEERLTTMIDIGLEQHKGIHHFVVLELLMAARNDKALAKVVLPHLMLSEDEIDEWWCEYFALMRWPKERLLAFRSLTVACLRGLSVDYVTHRNDEAHSQALDLMREMFLSFALNSKRS